MITKETLSILEAYGELQFSRQKVAIIMDDPVITEALTADPKSKKKDQRRSTANPKSGFERTTQKRS